MNASVESGSAEAPEPPAFGVGLICFGDFACTERAIESLAQTRVEGPEIPIYVGCNTCSPRVLGMIRSYADGGIVTGLIQSNVNLYKSPLMRDPGFEPHALCVVHGR